ncbi:MAG: hypothetical protein Ct9H300mP28_23680 [Pseudomonadota bacterium]|nr:MAG: hypothetical protein Ct9H300mP28_23680 [Pseudomonadota bacterium]
MTGLPDNYRLMFMHGGAQMQFSAVPLNLMARKSTKVLLHYRERGGTLAEKEARRYGKTEVLRTEKSLNTGEYRIMTSVCLIKIPVMFT